MNWIEIVGYIGSFLVLVSFLMTSVFRLRVVNTIGSVIFAIYALIIKSYPTAIMNICLVLINLHFLWNMRKESKSYELVETSATDGFVDYLVDKHRGDILACFPGIGLDFAPTDRAYIVCHEDAPVGLTIGRTQGDRLELLLDYSLPAYRDFSIGTFLFSRLPSKGYASVSYAGPDQNHAAYLTNMGFSKQDGVYIKKLGR